MRRDLDGTRDFFKDDRYAKMSAIEIEEVGELYARCSMKVQDLHLNARNAVMGGAIFTLADLCFGAAADGQAVSMTSEINFLAPAFGPVLVAEAHIRKDGRNIVYGQVDVTEGERLVACVAMTGFKIQK